jgi:hypothetical protein
MADFAVAMDGGQIKTGSVCRSERIAKSPILASIPFTPGFSVAFCWELISAMRGISCVPYCHHNGCMEALPAHPTAWGI